MQQNHFTSDKLINYQRYKSKGNKSNKGERCLISPIDQIKVEPHLPFFSFKLGLLRSQLAELGY
jgi:hypothetical protein